MHIQRVLSVIMICSLTLCVLLCGCTEWDSPVSATEFETTAEQQQSDASGIVINEYMTNNTYTLYDEEGDYPDWVELYNGTGRAVSLAGLYLTDNSEKPSKWAFPNDTTIGDGEYLVVFLSDKNKVTDSGELHAGFKLGGEQDNIIAIYNDASVVVDSLALVELSENVSYGRDSANPQELKYFSRPTPGAANDPTGFTELSATQSIGSRAVVISEVSAAYNVGNKTSGQYDWIELYNTSDKPVNLKGYGLYKTQGAANTMIFPDFTLGAGEYTVVYAIGSKALTNDEAENSVDRLDKIDSSKIPSDVKSKLIAAFKVDSSGDVLFLSDAEGNVVDRFFTGKLRIGITSGRADTLDRVFFTTPTKGTKNRADFCTSYSKKPSLSINGGTVSAGTPLTITATDGTVRYTTDGSEPTASSAIYTAPLSITKSITVKARCFEDGKLPSDTVNASFVIGKEHTLPVICISADPDDLFGYTNGILANGPGYGGDFPYVNANFWKDWEREATIEYFADGKKQVEFNAGINVFGQYTRAYDKKSLAIHLRDNYGAKSVTYPFFSDNSVTTFTDFVLRAGGQDSNKLELRDAFCAMVMKNNTDLAFMDWQPVALYINGEYYGFYNLREKINESYLESHKNIDKNGDISIIKGNSIVLAGTYSEYKVMYEYAKSHDLSIQENYDYMCSKMDIDSYIDYLIVEIFFCNGDTGNVKFYNGGKADDKWQWVMFGDALNKNSSSIEKLFSPDGHGSNNNFTTALQRALLANDSFKDKFVNRYAELLNSVFTEEYMTEVMDKMIEMTDKEMSYNAERWEKFSYNSWKNSYTTEIYQVIKGRRTVAIGQLKSYFSLSESTMERLFPNG